MYSLSVALQSVAEVRQFVDAASRCACEVDVLSGRYVVDAKSIMGLFSLDLTHTVNVEFHGGEDEFHTFAADVAPFVVEG